MPPPLIHPLADVQSTNIGNGTRIWQFVVILPRARLGRDCNICAHCFIENDVIVGSRVTIKNGVQLWDGVTIGDDVFIGPNVTFTNDLVPTNRNHKFEVQTTLIKDHVVIGAGAILLPGITIGARSMVAAGSVVTKNVPEGVLVMGSPARIVSELSNVDR